MFTKILSTTLLALTLSACAGETVYVHDPENGGTGTGGQGGESSVKSEQETAKGGAEAVTTTTATEAPKPELLCVPGASDECACPGGTKGAQSCAKDGMSYGECVCEARVVTITETKTETVTVNPEGYSGECVRVGITAATEGGPCWSSALVLYVNCPERPKTPGDCSSPNPKNGLTGAYCCNL